MSSCISGVGGRTYGFDFNFVKSQSTSTITSHTSSPSSTISESSNSQLAISTRKPRAPRKRPNQKYNEAVALLSTAYPNLFSTKNLKNSDKFSKPTDTFSENSSELFLPLPVFESSSFLLHQIQNKSSIPIEPRVVNLQDKPCQSLGEISSRVNSLQLDDDFEEDFDTKSIFDEEIKEGIDSIIGSRADDDDGDDGVSSCAVNPWSENCYSGKADFQLGLGRTGVRALRRVDEVNWWNFPTVDILQISPKITKPPATVPAEKKKKKKKVEKLILDSTNPEFSKENRIRESNQRLLLKLNYDEVLNAWSDKRSPFADESPNSYATEPDVATRLAQIDLFPEDQGVREASVLRYKERSRVRGCSRRRSESSQESQPSGRPRMKGRFDRRANSTTKPQR